MGVDSLSEGGRREGWAGGRGGGGGGGGVFYPNFLI